MRDGPDDSIPAFANFGFAIFSLLAAAAAYAHFNQREWQQQAAQQRVEHAKQAAENAERARLALEQEAEQAARDMIKSCQADADAFAASERDVFIKFRDEHMNGCTQLWHESQFERARETAVRIHSDYAALRSRCEPIVKLSSRLNGRRAQTVEQMTCESYFAAEIEIAAAPERGAAPAPSSADMGWNIPPAEPGISTSDPIATPLARTARSTDDTNQSVSLAGQNLDWSKLIWAREPGRRDFENARPPRASGKDFPAEVKLRCQIKPDGSLDCALVSEQPEGKGFASAAMKLARRYRAELQTTENKDTTGAFTDLTFVFEE